jgi:hypothetical protein
MLERQRIEAQSTIELRLAAFLRRAATRQPAFGVFDCGLLIADWCMEILGTDPAAALRGRYENLEAALALTGERSLPGLFDAQLKAVGVKRTGAPIYGDAAVIRLADGAARGAIVTSGYVVIGGGAGIGLSRVSRRHARRVCAWSISASADISARADGKEGRRCGDLKGTQLSTVSRSRALRPTL